jgi:uncharacterized protein with von Willebrand factor type A (vWA) domain
VGACPNELNREHPTSMRGAVVVIASDGWDLGDPEALAAEAEFLERLAHRVIRVNPNLQDPAFEPLIRGMSAALPRCGRVHSRATTSRASRSSPGCSSSCDPGGSDLDRSISRA